jgi:hypothetical protein
MWSITRQQKNYNKLIEPVVTLEMKKNTWEKKRSKGRIKTKEENKKKEKYEKKNRTKEKRARK